MNWDRIKGNWKELKGSARKQWGKLTDDDVEVIKGERERLSGRLQERYGYTKERAEQEIEAWSRKSDETDRGLDSQRAADSQRRI